MGVVGKIESLWRYPVKSMRGEELQEAFVGFAGVYGDRVYAFRNSAAPKGFHGFRRGIASNLFALGVNPRIIAGILRHAGMAMTLKHYTMIPDAEQRAALLKLEEKVAAKKPSGVVVSGDPA